MFLNSITSGDFTRVTTSAEYPLGSLAWDNPDPNGSIAAKAARQGPTVWRYVFNDDGATNWAAGNVVSCEAAKGPGRGRLSPANSNVAGVLGVAQHAIAFGSYGWVLCYGIGEVLADTGGITADTGLIVGDAAGTADNAAAIDNVAFGWSLDAVIAGALATSFIRCI